MTRTRIALVTSIATGLAMIGLAAPASAASCALKPAADGNIWPVVCPNGKANSKAEPKLTKLMPELMGLPANASFAQFKAAACTDFDKSNLTNPILSSGIYYQTVKLGWPKKYSNWFSDAITQGGGDGPCG